MKNFIKFILHELKPYKWTVVFCAVMAIIAALMDMAAPILMGYGFDLANKQQPFFYYAGALGLWFLLRFLSARLKNWVGFKGTSLGDIIGMNYTIRTMSDILNKPLSFHYGKRSNETSSKLLYFRYNFTSVIEGIFNFIPSILSILAILGYLFFIDWRVGVCIGLGVTFFLIYTFKMAAVWSKVRDRNNEMSRKVEQAGWDSLRNILVVKSTSNEGFFRRMLGRRQSGWTESNNGVIAFEKKSANIQDAITIFTSFAAVFVSVYNLALGRFTIGQLSAVVAYSFAIFGYITFVQWQARWTIRSYADYTALQKLLANPPEDFESGKKKEILGNVQFKNVAFGYSETRQILKDVNFSVKNGERVAIVGESGEGKTTLVDLLGRYYEPNRGEILVDNESVGKINLKSLRSQMAYVPQDLTLFHDTIEFNIRYGRPDAGIREIRRAAEQAHLTEFIAKLPQGWKTRVGERGLKLSGGERQRVALARAFLRNPKILILDEPTAHLDSKTENFIQEALKTLMVGRTTFIIAHRLRTVQSADKILVLKDGRIVESGRHEELIKKPKSVYVALLKAQGGYITPSEAHLK